MYSESVGLVAPMAESREETRRSPTVSPGTVSPAALAPAGVVPAGVAPAGVVPAAVAPGADGAQVGHTDGGGHGSDRDGCDGNAAVAPSRTRPRGAGHGDGAGDQAGENLTKKNETGVRVESRRRPRLQQFRLLDMHF